MAEHSGIDFPVIPNTRWENYGFSQVGESLVFLGYKGLEDNWKNFVKRNFEDFAKVAFKVMKLDSEKPKSRKRKLSTFYKSIFEQTDELAALVMIKAMSLAIDGEDDVDEPEIVDKIVRYILPHAGFRKEIEMGRYIWKVDERKKFKQNIGKAFVLNYISNKFDKDSVWKWLKKHCYRNDDGVWVYKSPSSKEKILKAVKPFLKDGGIFVEKNLNQEFTAFIPLNVVHKDAKGQSRFLLQKQIGENKDFYVSGVASNTSVDRDEERIGEDFIKSMKKDALGLPLLVNTHYAKELDDTIGVIVKTSGDKSTFEIEAKLEDGSENPNIRKILSKMEMGQQFGFSIGGRITKAYREFNKDLDKEIIVLAEGQLHHVLLTNQPANPTTFAEAVAKSLDAKKGGFERPEVTDDTYSMKHRSALHKSEPSREDVLKTVSELPDTAFPINHKEHEVCKDYAHHFVNDGDLFLHKGLLLESLQKAIHSGAPNYVVNHLKNHMTTIGLNKMIEEIELMKSSVENFEEIQKLSEDIVAELKAVNKAAKSVRSLSVTKEEKLNMIKGVIEDVSHNLSKLFETIDVEE